MADRLPPAPVLGVAAVIVKDHCAVIIKRANDPYKGEWSIPGGRVELGETLVQALQREMREETGLEVAVGDVIDVFERIQRDDDGRVRYHFVIVDYVCTWVAGELRAGDDAADARWVTADDLSQYEIRTSAAEVVRRGLAHAEEAQYRATKL